MTDFPRCQSCGCPLYRDALGTKLDGTPSPSYCKGCYQKGDFTEPYATVQTMVEREISRLVNEKILTDEKARELAEHMISRLKRWTQQA